MVSTDIIENKTFDELAIGDAANLSRVLTRADIDLFAVMSGDVNPAHVDEVYARSSQFHEIIAHGMWGGALISTVLGTQLPGPGTIYLGQTLSFHAPIGVGDRINIQVRVREKKEHKPIVIFDCVCTNDAGTEIITGTAKVMAPTEKIRRRRVSLPKISMSSEDGGFYGSLMDMAEGLAPLRTGIVHPCDTASLGGALAAAEEGLIIPVLIGPEHKIRAAAEEGEWDLSPYEMIPEPHSQAAAERAVAMVREGPLEALMKGKIHTDEFMEPIVAKDTGLRTARRMSHIFALKAPGYHKTLFLTDAAINIHPDLSAKRDIVQNAVDLVAGVSGRTPKVAIVSAVETVNEKIPSTLDATALCKMAERGQITGAFVDGPLAFDNAVSQESARAKGIVSQVAGDADIIVVPDIESGNMLYKQMRYLSGIEAAGVVLGARVPLILTSRAADAGITRKASCALALIHARRQEEKAALLAGTA